MPAALFRIIAALGFVAFSGLLAPTLFAGAAPPPTSVEQWDIFELGLDGPGHGNPFTDVELTARFTQGERTLTATGFYDGDGVYRIRFMPEAPGEWRYVTDSNRKELHGKTGAFTS